MAETIPQSTLQPDNKRKGSGFTNLQRVMDANTGNRLGQTVGGGIQQQAQRTKTDIGQAVQQFGDKTQQERFGTEANKNFYTQTLQDPTKAGIAEKTKLQKLMSGGYTGPKQLQGAQALQERARGAQQLGEATGSQSGRLGLLQRFAAPQSQRYTRGQQSLDALLLGQSEPDLQRGRREALGLERQYLTQQQTAGNIYGQMADEASRVGGEVKDTFRTEAQTFQDQLNEQAQRAKQQRDQYLEQVRTQAAEGRISRELVDRLGLQDVIGTQIGGGYSGIDLKKFIKADTEGPTIQGTANAEQIARMNALKDLSGGMLNPETQQILSAFEGVNPEQAQAYQRAAGYSFDREGFNRAIADRKRKEEQIRMNTSDPTIARFWVAQQRIDEGSTDPRERALADHGRAYIQRQIEEQLGSPRALQVFDPLEREWDGNKYVSGSQDRLATTTPVSIPKIV